MAAGVAFRWLESLLLWALILGWGIGSASSGAPLGEGAVIDVPADADTFVSAARPSMNFGSQFLLRAFDGERKVTYLRFNLSKIPVSEVVNARLRLHVINPSSDLQQLRLVTDGVWDEQDVTFDHRPAVEGVVGSFCAKGRRGWWEVDVTMSVANAHAGMISFAVFSGGLDPVGFDSRESTDFAPALRMVLHEPVRPLVSAGFR